MATYTFTFLCVFGCFAALQVPGASAFWFLSIFGKKKESQRLSSDPNEIVNKHNDLRRAVKPTASNMLKMSWNSEAAANAEKWAITCPMDHSSDSDRKISNSECGENLYMSSNEKTWSYAIQRWYDEVKNWRYGVGSVGGVVGHFTQVVWYNSHEIGCARAHCPNSEKYKYFYVCHYCPPGNYQFARPYKNGRPCADCPNSCENNLCTNPYH